MLLGAHVKKMTKILTVVFIKTRKKYLSMVEINFLKLLLIEISVNTEANEMCQTSARGHRRPGGRFLHSIKK